MPASQGWRAAEHLQVEDGEGVAALAAFATVDYGLLPAKAPCLSKQRIP